MNTDINTENISQTNIHLTEYLKIFFKRKWLILSIMLSILIPTVILTFSATPLFESSAKIMIEKENQKVLSFDEIYSIDASNIDFYQTQYEILRSKTLAKKVFEKLKLDLDPEYQDPRDPVHMFMKTYNVEPIRNSRLVLVKVRHRNPEKAALISNTLAKFYIDQNLELKLQATHYAVNWLTEQLFTLQEKTGKSEYALQEYIEKHKLVSLSALESGNSSGDLIGYLKKERINLETKYSQLSKRYKEKHPKMLRLQSQIDTIKENIDQESKLFLETRNKQIEYNILKRETTTNQELYNAVLSRTKETNLFEALKVNNISIIDPAEVPVFSIWPRKRMNIILALFFSTFFGLGLALFLDYLDSTIKDEEDIEEHLKLPVLGHIPKANSLKNKINEKDLDLACFNDPRSTFAEAYRYVRTATLLSAVDKPYSTLLVTSTAPKEGKTTEAINLAITMAAAGDKVLLIDADMRNPRIHKIFPQNSQIGLSNLLSSMNNSSVKSSAVPTQIPNLSIIPGGQIPPNPAELLSSTKLESIISEAKSQFQRIIIDTPPVMAVVDPIILSSVVDGIIYIIQAGKLNRKFILKGINRIQENQAKILGVVLNQVIAKNNSSYYYYYSAYSADNGKTPKNDATTLEEKRILS